MKRLLPLVLVICAAIGCTPKHNLEIRLKGFHNDTLIFGCNAIVGLYCK